MRSAGNTVLRFTLQLCSSFDLQEECDSLKEELSKCQESLKAAKSDSARRARALQVMQQKLGEEGNNVGHAEELEAERLAEWKASACFMELQWEHNTLRDPDELLRFLEPRTARGTPSIAGGVPWHER